MYNLPHFKAKNEAEVIGFMKANPFIVLTGADANGKPVATQVPVILSERDGKIFLRGHIMRNTDHHRAFMDNQNVLALFTSPHTYVSASWYTNPQQGSTWNYMAVHAKGEISFLPDEDLIRLLDELTAVFENDAASPALFKHIPQDYIDRMTKAIVAFEISVNDIEHVFKLSQNRDVVSYDAITAKLEAGDAGAKFIAEEMRKRKTQFFPA